MLPRLSQSSRRWVGPSTALCYRNMATEVVLPPQTPVLRTGVVLTRSPFLTRTPTSFERAYYAYQNRLRRALSNPFPHNFYFKPGALLEGKFQLEERKRENWLFHRRPSSDELESQQEQIKSMSEVTEEEFIAEKRSTTSDFHKNPHSLNRMGERTLYLLLRATDEKHYAFPENDVVQGELLHEAARRGLDSSCGSQMDTWIVGRHPIGFHDRRITNHHGSKIFFYKSHILAGQVQINSSRYSDFLWLAKEEIEALVFPDYWHSIRDMLSQT